MTNNNLISTLQGQVAVLEQEKARAIDAAVRDNDANVVVPKQHELNKEMTEKLTSLNAEYSAKESAIREDYAKRASEFAAREKSAITFKVGSEYDNAIAKIKALYEGD